MKKTTDLSGTSKGYKVFSVAILVVMVIFFLFPLYWIVTGSFKNKLEITARTPIWFPIEPTVENYARLFDNPAFLWLFNIIFISAAAMILTCLTASLAKQFSETIPTEILEAARVDGAGELRTFITVVFPMIKPGIGALAIFTFVNTWNDYFLQLVMLTSKESWTLPLAIANLQGEMSTDFGLIMAGAALASIPIIIVFVAFQKYFTQGIAMGAVKG